MTRVNDFPRDARASSRAMEDLAKWFPVARQRDDALKRESRAKAEGRANADDAARARERGNTEFRAMRFNAAHDAYTESVEIEPSAATHANRAMCRLKMKDYAGCVEDCDACLALDGMYGSKIYHRRGVANRELGEYLASVMDFERALRLEPRNVFLKEERAKSQRAFELEAKIRPTQTRHRVSVEDDGEASALTTNVNARVSREKAQSRSESEEEEEVTIRRVRSTDSATTVVASPSEPPSSASTDVVKAAMEIATRKPLSAPRTGAEFEKIYRRAMKLAAADPSTPAAHRLEILRLVPASKIPSMFASGLDADILADITTVVLTSMLERDRSSAIEWLDALPRLPRFAVAVALRSRASSAALAAAFDVAVARARARGGDDDDVARSIARARVVHALAS